MGNQSSKEYNLQEHGQVSRELFDSYIADEKKFEDLSAKTVAITGTSTQSIGFHIAEIAIRKNAKVLMLCHRDSSSAKKGYEELVELAKECNSKTDIKTVTCDLQDLESVKEAGKKINEIASDGLDVMVCNAGVMALKDVRTKDGFEIQMQTNQLSHFLLASNVWPSIVKAAKTRGGARLVTHSSSARYSPPSNLRKEYFMKCEPGTLGGDRFWAVTVLQAAGICDGPWQRYHQSKLANANFAMEMHDKLQSSGDETLKKIQANSADPGLATSNLQVTTMNDGGMPSWLLKLLSRHGQSPADGSLPIGLAAFGKDTKSGSFFQPEKDAAGPPIATVEEGASTNKKGAEKLVVSPENKENIWKWCEEALDIKFSLE